MLLRRLACVPRNLQNAAATALAMLLIVPTAAAQEFNVDGKKMMAVSGLGVLPSRVQEELNDGLFTSSEHESGVHIYSFYGRPELGPWSVRHGNVALHVDTGESPLKGGNVVDLNGTRGGAIVQHISTVIGQYYTLRFHAKGNWKRDRVNDRRILVKAGRPERTLFFPRSFPNDDMLWQDYTLSFRATSVRTGIEFASLDPYLRDGVFITGVELDVAEPPAESLRPLSSVPVPLPDNLSEFVVNRDKAIALGKALFWDVQAGSDGVTACASCHWAAGTDHRTRNSVYIGAHGTPFDNPTPEMESRHLQAEESFRGANTTLKPEDFPFRRLTRPSRPGDEPEAGLSLGNPVVSDTVEIGASQGVILSDFLGFDADGTTEIGSTVIDDEYNFMGVNARIPTERNTPTMINAVFFDRLFWDGRANHFFNGVNNWGDLDEDARVMKSSAAGGPMQPVQILLNNAALASQAVGPVLSTVEMSWMGREFPDVGRKMLALQPLAKQRVAADDSVLGPYAMLNGEPGLNPETASYAQLIREAFAPEWWASEDQTDEGYSQMEINFSLFWGLSIMLYESTLVSDQSPYDSFASGDHDALSDQAKRGLNIFLNEGRCSDCHDGAVFSEATVASLRSVPEEGEEAPPLIEQMEMADLQKAWYDKGFYNLGIRAELEDIGAGAEHPEFGPLSYSRQEQAGQNPDPVSDVAADERTAVDGSFKTPSLRNVELTGPYMNNGGFATLEQVVEFYTRGADFFRVNKQNVHPTLRGIPSMQGNPEKIADLVAFLRSLTDERVRHAAAPFDHPELLLPNGHLAPENGAPVDNLVIIPATGREGGSATQTFAEALRSFDAEAFTGESLPVAEFEPIQPKRSATLDRLAEKNAAASKLSTVAPRRKLRGPYADEYRR